MANALTVTGSSQSQGATNDPQSAVQSLNTGTPSGNVQPGTASPVPATQPGIPLRGTALSTVNLAPGAATTGTQTPKPAASLPKHHTNPVLFGAAMLLVVVAIALFWLTGRSVKSTT